MPPIHPEMLNPEMLKAVITIRLATLDEIQSKIESLRQNERDLVELFIYTATDRLRKILSDNMTVTLLLHYGRTDFKIVWQDGEYGFKSAAEVRKAFLALKKAWKNAVKITFDDEVHRTTVSLRVPL